MSTYRPVVQVTAEGPFKSGWQSVSPTACAGYVSVSAAGQSRHHGAGPGDADLRTERMEYVACIEAAMVQATRPRVVPNMTLAGWGLTGVESWRLLQTDMTRETWIKYTGSAAVTATSVHAWYTEPGVAVRFIPYAPHTTATAAWFDLMVGDGAGTTWAKVRFPTLPPGEPAGGAPALQVQAKPTAMDPTTGKTLAVYEGSWSAGNFGGAVDLRLRIVKGKDTWLVLAGTGLGDEWAIKLPAGSYPRQAYLSVGYRGGMFAFHVAQMSYLSTGGTWKWVGAGPRRYPQVNRAGADEQLLHFWLPAGMRSAPYAAWAFSGSSVHADTYSSPALTGISRWVEPYFMEPAGSPSTMAGCQRVELSMSGRSGYTCALTWRDKDLSATSAFERNGVVTVKAGMVGDELSTLFVGRVGGPVRHTNDGGILAQPTVTLLSDDMRLDKQLMITMPGSWSFTPFRDAFRKLLLAGGVSEARAVTLDDEFDTPPVLLPGDGLELQFGPETTIRRALDAICTARGVVWWCDRFGVYHADTRRPLAAPADHTLDIHSSAFLGFVPSISHEVTTDGDYANAVYVESPTGVSAVYAPADRALADGGTWWRYVRRETPTPGVVAKQVYDEVSGAKRTVTWREVWDPSDFCVPENVVEVAAGTDPSIGLSLSEGQLLRVRDVRLVLDLSGRMPMGEVTYTASVGDED